MLQSRNRDTAVENTCICRRFFPELRRKAAEGRRCGAGRPQLPQGQRRLHGARTAPGAGGRRRSKGGCRWEGLCGGPAGTEGGLTKGPAPQEPEGVRKESRC